MHTQTLEQYFSMLQVYLQRKVAAQIREQIKGNLGTPPACSFSNKGIQMNCKHGTSPISTENLTNSLNIFSQRS